MVAVVWRRSNLAAIGARRLANRLHVPDRAGRFDEVAEPP